nr:DEAD/DEAH box helicase [uncultured Alistipes sp.]
MRFDELDLEDEILDGLDDMHFEEMTPVQEHTIPVILEGRDLIGCAQTGTGKTAAYTLPLLNKLLLEGNDDNVIKSVIIVPTRELAQQIDQQFQGFSYYLPVSTTVVYGGGDGKGWDIQKKGMLMGSDVVIATPGRMISHLQNSGVDLSHVEYLILDEADRMLDMGFADDIMKIISYMPRERQTIMFSATLPPKIRELAKSILRNPAEVNIAISKPNEAIDQSAYVCYESQKLGIIRELFAEPTESKTIIFSSSKLKVKELAHTLKRMKLNVAAMHSDLEQAQREEVMLDFKNNKVNILVATDIVARGIDIEDIGLVINYDVPRDPEDYIHRIGRTARAAATGSAVTFVNEEEQGAFHRIEKFIERDIRKAELPASVGEGPKYAPDESRGRGRGRGGRSKGGDGRGHGRGRRDRLRDNRGRSAAASPAAPQPAAEPAPAENSAPAAAEAAAATAKRRRHRGGRRHRRGGDKSGAPQAGGAQPAGGNPEQA